MREQGGQVTGGQEMTEQGGQVTGGQGGQAMNNQPLKE